MSGPGNADLLIGSGKDAIQANGAPGKPTY